MNEIYVFVIVLLDVHNVSDQWLVRLCPNMNVVVCAFIGLCCFMWFLSDKGGIS